MPVANQRKQFLYKIKLKSSREYDWPSKVSNKCTHVTNEQKICKLRFNALENCLKILIAIKTHMRNKVVEKLKQQNYANHIKCMIACSWLETRLMQNMNSKASATTTTDSCVCNPFSDQLLLKNSITFSCQLQSANARQGREK
jgi:uncharacterized membrane-anchored protein YjiN (DUF445 family)